MNEMATITYLDRFRSQLPLNVHYNTVGQLQIERGANRLPIIEQINDLNRYLMVNLLLSHLLKQNT